MEVMDKTWDLRTGLTCLLDALDHPELDTDSQLDLMEVPALLAQAAARRQDGHVRAARWLPQPRGSELVAYA
jgi:hypothetical protein